MYKIPKGGNPIDVEDLDFGIDISSCNNGALPLCEFFRRKTIAGEAKVWVISPPAKKWIKYCSNIYGDRFIIAKPIRREKQIVYKAFSGE